MKELFKTLRLAFYVFSLPLAITAVVSAQQLVTGNQDSLIDEVANVSETEATVETLPPVTPVPVTVADRHTFLTYVDSEGGLTGRVSAVGSDGSLYGANGVNVSINRRGEKAASAITNEEGIFRFDSVNPGSYTFIASSPEALTAFGMYIASDPENKPASDEIQISPVAVTNQSLAPVREIMNKDIQPLSLDYLVDPMKETLPVTSGANQVHLTADGSLVGRIVPLDWSGSEDSRFDMSVTSVYIYQNGQVVGETRADADGNYVIENVAPGFYDLVAFGPYGGGAYCTNVTEAPSITSNLVPALMGAVSSTSMISSSRQGGADIVLTEPQGSGPDVIIIEEFVPVQTGGGGPFGGGGAFGGGFGGIGGLGDLVGLGVGLWVLSELIDEIDDDDDIIRQPTVVPPVVIPPVVVPPASPTNV